VRVLLVVHGYPPEDLGGTETHTATVARLLSERGHDVWVLAGRGQEDRSSRSIVDGTDGDVAVRRLHVPLEDRSPYKLRDGWTRGEFERLLDAVRPDVVHIQHLARLSADLIESARTRSVPTVVTLHDLWFQCAAVHPRAERNGRFEACRSWIDCARRHELRPLRRNLSLARQSGLRSVLPRGTWRSGFLRRQLQLADIVLPPSDFIRDAFVRFGVAPDKVHVMPHGTDLVRDVANGRHDPIRFGYVGSLVPAKGVQILCEAFAGLTGDSTLHLYGRRSDDRYARGIDAFLGSRIRYEGEFRAEDAGRVYRALDVLVAPSIVHESFGLTVIEAQAFGIPVIVSRAGALPERVRDEQDGLVVPPGDSAALRRALARLAEPAEVTRFAERISEPRSMSSYIEELEGIYAKLVSDQQGRIPAHRPGEGVACDE
jgi:glycosyltransferase involved in cell wall biosynthesis